MSLDFIAGMFGGAAGVIVGHPFDTIKVRLQAPPGSGGPQYKGTLDVVRKIIRFESPAGFYKGISSPLSGLAFINAIVFGTYANVSRRFEDPGALHAQVISGAIAGATQAVICAPMELAKLQVQLQGTTANPLTPLDCLRRVHASFGLRGVFHGFTITVMRDVTGFGIYFAVYESLISAVRRRREREPNAAELLMSGGLAGTASWVMNYPIDVVKTRLQADPVLISSPVAAPAASIVSTTVRLDANGQAFMETTSGAPVSRPKLSYNGILDCARQSYKAEGHRVFSRGLAPTIMRAFPTNAVTFFTVAMFYRLYERMSNPVVDELVMAPAHGTESYAELEPELLAIVNHF